MPSFSDVSVLVTGSLLLLVLGASGSNLPPEIAEEIAAQKGAVDEIMQYVLSGAGRHGTYNQLAVYSDDYGPRLSGSQDLEDAIDYTMDQLNIDGFANVHGEDVPVPQWTRGEPEEAAILEPRFHRLYILSLGTSVGTPPGGIEAEVIVVRSFDELEQRSAEVPGKIVVYNQPWVNYDQSVEYRALGATEAAKHGAVAALVRSVTHFSVNSPHVGHQLYTDPDPSTWIPSASVTVEDAEMMQRLHDRGKKIVVSINMTCENLEDTTSRNVVADFVGSKYPDEYVIIGGHIDTWDVGYGPMDDGGAVIMSWQVMKILQALGLQPKRTVRSVFWTGEEFGLLGGNAYFEAHKEANHTISLIMESDAGMFTPKGIGFTGSGLARAMMEEIVLLLADINATLVGPDGYHPDIGEWINIGVPGGNLMTHNEDYFIYHHSHGDSMTMEDPDVLDLCTVVWAAVTYVVANLEDKLPRTGAYPEPSSASSLKSHSHVIVFILLLCLFISKKNR